MKNIRIALVVFRSVAHDPKSNLDRMYARIKQAKDNGAAIICFPEMNITGYGIEAEIFDAAETVPGPSSKRLAQLSKELDITILAGIAEKEGSENIYATHMVITPDGGSKVYRKVHIAPPEKNTFSAGDNIPVFESHGIKFGVQLCYDAHFPELTTRMALKGVDIIFIPHASPNGSTEGKFKSWMRHLPARAFDNGIFIAACNQAGENEKGRNFPGIALVIGPNGEVIEKDDSGEEGILFADLKAEAISHARDHRMRYFLPNRRGDLFD
ncbi:MAG: nitrilase [Desulfobacterales bacterium]|nr:nitrilase [Desulfobacterales bacterium]